jgi:hypothetical protein
MAIELEKYLNNRLGRALDFVLHDLGLTAKARRPGQKPRKQDLARTLVEWVSCSKAPTLYSPILVQRLSQPRKSSMPANVKVSSPERVDQFRDVIRKAVTPSHVGSVPNNFGAASAGTPKAEEWRKVFTIFLPLALILMFGLGIISELSEMEASLYRVLDHTMHLVCAIRLACKRVTTP